MYSEQRRKFQKEIKLFVDIVEAIKENNKTLSDSKMSVKEEIKAHTKEEIKALQDK